MNLVVECIKVRSCLLKICEQGLLVSACHCFYMLYHLLLRLFEFSKSLLVAVYTLLPLLDTSRSLNRLCIIGPSGCTQVISIRYLFPISILDLLLCRAFKILNPSIACKDVKAVLDFLRSLI